MGDGVSLSSTRVFDHPTARQVALHLQGSEPSEACCSVNQAAPQHGVADVEVSGLSMALPAGVAALAAAKAAAATAADDKGQSAAGDGVLAASTGGRQST